jgi:hypothetical protein
MSRFLSRFVPMMAALLLGTVPALADGVGGSDVSGVGFTGGNSANVQVNIDTTKVIDSSSNIVVNKVFNGVNVGYGMGGASVLGVINQRSADAQALHDQRSATVQQVQSQASYIAQVAAAYGY